MDFLGFLKLKQGGLLEFNVDVPMPPVKSPKPPPVGTCVSVSPTTAPTIKIEIIIKEDND
jgi:hypothetical protein